MRCSKTASPRAMFFVLSDVVMPANARCGSPAVLMGARNLSGTSLSLYRAAVGFHGESTSTSSSIKRARGGTASAGMQSTTVPKKPRMRCSPASHAASNTRALPKRFSTVAHSAGLSSEKTTFSMSVAAGGYPCCSCAAWRASMTRSAAKASPLELTSSSPRPPVFTPATD